MWYVIQTITGKEQELIDMIQKMVIPEYYESCFFIKRECARYTKTGIEIFNAAMFPSYVFVISEQPEELSYELKKIPLLSKLLKEEGDFLAIDKEEEKFLEDILCGNAEHVVVRSWVEIDNDRKIVRANGPLEKYMDKIIRQRLRKRYVWIEQEFLGVKRKILLGIRLETE